MMNGNPNKSLSLMDELSNAGFCSSKNDSLFSQEDFTTNLNADPVARLNFSDVVDITSFDEKHLQTSTPFVIPSRNPVESDDITVDSNVFKGYTKKLQNSSMLSQKSTKLTPPTSNPPSYQAFGLSLEQELQQAISQDNNSDNNGDPVKRDIDISKGLASAYSSVGLEQLQKTKPQNDSVDVSNNESLVKNDIDINKGLVLPCSNVGLNLEQEVQQVTSENNNTDNNEYSMQKSFHGNKDLSSINACLSLEEELQQATSKSSNDYNNDCPLENDIDVSKDLVSNDCNESLNLEQELQQATLKNDTVDIVSKSVNTVTSDLDVSNVGLNLKLELQQALSEKNGADVSNGGYPVKNNFDVSKDLSRTDIEPELQQSTFQNCNADINEYSLSKDLQSSHGNVGLSLEQDLKINISKNNTSDIVNSNKCPLKNGLDVSKDLPQMSLEQELQQATSQNTDGDDNGHSMTSDLSISNDLLSSCTNVELSLKEELKKDSISQNKNSDVSNKRIPLKNDLDVSKDMVSMVNGVGLNLEKELPQTNIDISNNEYPLKNNLDVSQDLVYPSNNFGLNLEQELQQASPDNSNANIIDKEDPLKLHLNSSCQQKVDVEPQNESLNQQNNLKPIEDTQPENKELIKLENKMELSVYRGTLDSNQEQEIMEDLEESHVFHKEIDKNASKVSDTKQNVSMQDCLSPDKSGETDRHVTKNDCMLSMKTSNNSDEFGVLNTLNYLGFESEKLNPATAALSDLEESDGYKNLSMKSNEGSVGVCKKRNIKMDPCHTSTTDASPEKKTKIGSETNLCHSALEGTKFPEMSLKTNGLPKADLLNFDASECNLDKEQFVNAQLLKKIEILEKELENQQLLTTRAAELGMQVVEENSELKNKTENLLTKIAKAEEERENERHANKLKFQNKEYMEQQYNEEISHLKEEISKLKQALETAEKAETNLTRQLKSMEYSSEQSQFKEQQRTTTIKHLEKLLQEKTDQMTYNSTFSQMDDDGNIEQINALQQEVIGLQNNNTLLKSQLISHEANMKRLEEELTHCQQYKQSKEQEIDEMKCEINSYHKTLEATQTEVLDLKAQLHAAQIEKNMSHKDRGNSLFSEVEDRRVLAEKMVVTLQQNYESLKERYDVEKQQHHKLKMQAVSLLQMNSGKVSEDYAKQLNSMLLQANNEVKELQEKVKNYQKNEAQQAEKMVKIQNTFGTNENRDFIDFLNSLNDIKQKEVDDLKEKLNNIEMQYLQESSKVVDYIKKLCLIEEEVESLRCANMKLKLRVEELMMKYNPDEFLEEKSSRKTYVEKIALGPKQNIAQSLMKQKTRQKEQAKVSAEKQPKCRAQQIAELVRCGALNPANLLKESPKAKKVVSLSSEVTLIDDDGKEEKRMNLDTENVPVKLERRRPPKGKLADKIIEVKSPVHGRREDCKQQ